ncbi:MAG: metallophosphoesterase family protein [Candidatus Thermoplasmatota archaeon]|nr:metallophosphoesterase family protein [Candidatus Thermoplasmatota archaeon]
MKLAVLSDIHANPWALRSVLEEIDEADRIIVLGDIVGIGPEPRDVIDILMRDDRVEKVMGNHDHNTLYGTELGPIDIVPRGPHHEWVRSRLNGTHLDYLKGPMVINSSNGMEMVFMHRHPDDCGSKVPYFDSPTPGVLDSFYTDVEGSILFFGHTHVPLDVTGRTGRRYINPGAVGAQNRGLASYVLLDTDRGPISIERKEAPYDVRSVVEGLEHERPPYHRFIISHFF